MMLLGLLVLITMDSCLIVMLEFSGVMLSDLNNLHLLLNQETNTVCTLHGLTNRILIFATSKVSQPPDKNQLS